MTSLYADVRCNSGGRRSTLPPDRVGLVLGHKWPWEAGILLSDLTLKCDVAIIGAGTAGLAAERSARRAGAATLLIDPSFNGTTCANVGCMPSKLLIAASNAAHDARRAGKLGIKAVLSIDGPAVMARLRSERDAFAEATREDIAKLPEHVRVRAQARFIDENTLGLSDGRRVEARSIVIATGSRPSIPKLFDNIRDRLLTNESVFEISDLPRSLAVVGAGPLGLELAQAFARLGVAVAVFAEDHRIGGVEQEPFPDRIREVLEQELVLHLGVKVQSRPVGDGVCLQWDGAASGERVFDRVLVATGRPPELKSLQLEATALKLGKHGVPLFDRQTMQCGESGVFLAGDVCADRPVLHEASAEGSIAGYNAASFPHVTATHRMTELSIIFTDPPVCLIGQRAGDSLVWGESDYRRQGRAKVEARAEGLVRLYADPADARLTGATLFCPGADHLGHLLAWAIDDRLDASTLLDRPFYHPTFEEGLKTALRQICKKVGIAPPPARDQGSASGA